MRKIKTRLGRELRVPGTTSEAYTEARETKTRAWRLLLESLDLYEEAELLFKTRTDVIRERFDLGPTTPLTVEALKVREADEQWRMSIADADFMAKRATMASAVYTAAVEREKDVLEAVKLHKLRQRNETTS